MIDTTGPKVSVIMPTYKRDSAYLGRALASLLQQSYTNIEIVVVDDNPADSEYRVKTVEFMKRYATEPRIVYHLNEKNVGGSLARNIGIDLATGEFVTFLDDDDEYLPEKIAHQVAFMLETDVDMSFADLNMVNPDGVFLYKREHPTLKHFDQESLLKYHLTKKITGTPTFMYKTESLRAIGGFDDIKVGQEYITMLKSIERGLTIAYLPKSDVVAYAHAGGGISQGRNKIEGEKRLHALRKQYFSRLSLRERMYVNFRHHAGQAVTYIRNKQFFHAIGHALAMFVSSPVDTVKEIFSYGTAFFKKKKA